MQTGTDWKANVSIAESAAVDRIVAAMAARDEVATIEKIERKSEREFDVKFDAAVNAQSPTIDGARMTYRMSGWLPLAFIRECMVWPSAKVADMTDYPEMVKAGDWSGVRDSEPSKIWAIFETAAPAIAAKAKPPKPPKATKVPTSRPARWNDAIQRARGAMDAITAAGEDLAAAFGDLEDIRNEYEDWQGNLPDNLQSSPLGEKLDAVVGLCFDCDVEDAMQEMSQVLDEAEAVDLPRGFGKD